MKKTLRAGLMLQADLHNSFVWLWFCIQNQIQAAVSCSLAAHQGIHRQAWTLCYMVLTSIAFTPYITKALQYLMRCEL